MIAFLFKLTVLKKFSFGFLVHGNFSKNILAMLPVPRKTS